MVTEQIVARSVTSDELCATHLFITGMFCLFLFNLVLIQSTPGAIRVVPFSYFICTFVTALIEDEVSGCSRGSVLSLRVQLRRLSSRTKRNWILQKPTQPVRFNRAFKHTHWLLWGGFVCDYSSLNRSGTQLSSNAFSICRTKYDLKYNRVLNNIYLLCL